MAIALAVARDVRLGPILVPVARADGPRPTTGGDQPRVMQAMVSV